MLVVSRRPNEKLVFPALGITIQIAKVNGQTVRLGVIAPRDVQVLRHELAGETADAPGANAPGRRLEHQLRNAMSKLTLGLHLARRQAEAGHVAEADATLAQALASLAALENEAVGQGARSTDAPCGCRALIVEDDTNERELLAGLLQMNGCICTTAGDGEDALAHLATGERPDVVLLDMGMPRCDGPETLRRLRADDRFRDLRVLSVSGTDPRMLGVSVGPGGVDGWFQKPLNPQRLWSAIQASIHSPVAAN